VGPLAGIAVVVTRPLAQAAPLVALLEAVGAQAVVVPLVEIVDVDAALLEGALADLGPGDWLVVASPNGAVRVAPLLERVTAHVAAVGATTAATLGRVDLAPERQNAEGLVAAFPPAPTDRIGRALVVQAAEGSATLTSGLTALGWTVRRLDTHRAVPLRPTTREQFHALKADAVLFTSGSQARAWVATFGTTTPPVVAVMGPQTAADAEAAGLKVGVVATDHSLAGSVDALVAFFQG